ncbi:hypothetical protein P691DRAFT_246282 [Macrolepiota fuliginosa MF-IS2]|uniref:Uncharacterized protein n=1 Tax=Macrolepiota fuliginosa MF-IS2 TaxID=1400762 RepID=A0A9P5XKS5_9AGAR|nr:hypothetical protein P691DRAFT_246282 [Macrolepiota fuliginosa MF-IS2]
MVRTFLQVLTNTDNYCGLVPLLPHLYGSSFFSDRKCCLPVPSEASAWERNTLAEISSGLYLVYTKGHVCRICSDVPPSLITFKIFYSSSVPSSSFGCLPPDHPTATSTS